MKIYDKISMPVRTVKIISQYEPLYFILTIPKIIISAVLPLINVYFPKIFIEQLTSNDNYITILKKIISYILILLCLNGAHTVITNKISLFTNRFIKSIHQQIGDFAMSLPFEMIESAEYRDKLMMSNNITQVAGVIDLLQNIISSIITIIGLSAIIAHLDMIFILLVFLILGFKVLFVYLTYKHNEKRRKLYAANNRIGDYLNNIAYFNQGAAKEIRVNNLQNWFMKKVKSFRDEMLHLQYGDFKMNALFESITAFMMAAQSFIILYILSLRYLDNIINIADFTMYFNAIIALTGTLSVIVGNIGEYNRQSLNVSDYNTLDNMEFDKIDEPKRSSFNDDNTIVFKNVFFKYPNKKEYVLKNVNVKITPGKKISIVGQNGAGKSTFIKLLCKFYRPTNGVITIGGNNIWDIDNNQYYQLIAAVFQDYQNFAFTLEENVTFGSTDRSVKSLFSEVGLKNLIDRLLDGINTYITRNFNTQGIELSGGENQKLAIARAIYKNSPILILDEPTASLDPKSESEIYDDFFAASAQKTTIFISHRLASSTKANEILVFDHGEVIERGNHMELMTLNGKYAEMFNLQKESYAKSII